MAIHDLFFKRMKRRKGEVPDVYQYSEMTQGLRVQVIHIWRDLFFTGRFTESVFTYVRDSLCREYRVFSLGRQHQFPNDEVEEWFLSRTTVEDSLTVVELVFSSMSQLLEIGASYQDEIVMRRAAFDAAIEELNKRFQEDGFGFQVENNQIIRNDSQLLHAEAVKPALIILGETRFCNADDEFRSAYEHYRHNRFAEALVDACKTFESVMKIICTERKWTFDESKATAAPLIALLIRNELIPLFLENHLTGLKMTLEAGVPTVRNKLGGHGAGAESFEVPRHFVAYALHLTACNIVMLAEADKALPR
jgi:hypothetical protein